MTTTTKYLSVRPAGYFLRHLGEMILAMMAGMVAGVAVLALIFSTVLASTIRGMPRVEVLNQFAVLICLVMAVGMTVPMVAWMRYRYGVASHAGDGRGDGRPLGADLRPARLAGHPRR